MCVLSIKHDKNLLPLHAKSHIVVLGNHEDRVWSKSNQDAPVLWSDSLRFLVTMAVSKHRPLCQGDCKNAFCQGVLPEEEITIVWTPSGDPEVQPHEYWLLLCILYGLCQSPCHWYDKITKILVSIGLTPSLEDPCLFTGFVHNPHQPNSPSLVHPLLLGLYVYDFVYFSKDPAVEALFCCLIGERCKVNFMCIVEWFPGVHFSWRISSLTVSVHMNQSGFASNLVKNFFCETCNETPLATLYWSSIPVDSITSSTDTDDSPAQLW
jgi:hypothetical protein